MRCANGHDNVDVEIFCCECGEVMPPLGGTTQMRIRWSAEVWNHRRLQLRLRCHRGRSRGRAVLCLDR